MKTLIQSIITNFALFDFSLIIKNIGLNGENGSPLLSLFSSPEISSQINNLVWRIVERLLSMLANNVSHLDISENYLGALGMDLVGGALSSNMCIKSLVMDFCFKVDHFSSLPQPFYCFEIPSSSCLAKCQNWKKPKGNGNIFANNDGKRHHRGRSKVDFKSYCWSESVPYLVFVYPWQWCNLHEDGHYTPNWFSLQKSNPFELGYFR